jgi:5'(3')-deoxyribonucleotidase
MKPTLYLDFDSTIVNSERAFCQVYNTHYRDFVGFSPAQEEHAGDWVFRHACPLIHELHVNPVAEVQRIFGMDDFFNALEFYEGADLSIQSLRDHYEIVICTSASPENGSKKVLWIEQHMPYVDEIIVLVNKSSNGVGKGRVHMLEPGAIFVDDHPANLRSTEAQRKILFTYNGRITDYNRGWTGETVSSWEALRAELIR